MRAGVDVSLIGKDEARLLELAKEGTLALPRRCCLGFSLSDPGSSSLVYPPAYSRTRIEGRARRTWKDWSRNGGQKVAQSHVSFPSSSVKHCCLNLSVANKARRDFYAREVERRKEAISAKVHSETENVTSFLTANEVSTPRRPMPSASWRCRLRRKAKLLRSGGIFLLGGAIISSGIFGFSLDPSPSHRNTGGLRRRRR